VGKFGNLVAHDRKGFGVTVHRGHHDLPGLLLPLPELEVKEYPYIMQGKREFLRLVQHFIDSLHNLGLGAPRFNPVGIDKGAAPPDLPDKPALFQYVIGVFDSPLGNAAFIGQLPHCGKLVSLKQFAQRYIPGELFYQLLVQRPAFVDIKLYLHAFPFGQGPAGQPPFKRPVGTPNGFAHKSSIILIDI
jgi:hypothetical protein